jgi:hypothetical protein
MQSFRHHGGALEIALAQFDALALRHCELAIDVTFCCVDGHGLSPHLVLSMTTARAANGLAMCHKPVQSMSVR